MVNDTHRCPACGKLAPGGVCRGPHHRYGPELRFGEPLGRPASLGEVRIHNPCDECGEFRWPSEMEEHMAEHMEEHAMGRAVRRDIRRAVQAVREMDRRAS